MAVWKSLKLQMLFAYAKCFYSISHKMNKGKSTRTSYYCSDLITVQCKGVKSRVIKNENKKEIKELLFSPAQ